MSKKKVSVTLELDEDIYSKAKDYLSKANMSFDDTMNELIRQMILHNESIESGLISRGKQSSWFFPKIEGAMGISKMNEEDVKTIQDFLEILKYN